MSAGPWLATVRADLVVLRSDRRGPRYAQALARLADTAHAVEVDRALAAHAADNVVDPWLGYALARRRLARDDQSAAQVALERAQAGLGRRDDAALIARIAFTIGGLQVTSSELTAADLTLAWGESLLGRGAPKAPDLAHLRALIAEQRGDREMALVEYRKAIGPRIGALTPLSAVLAMRNLGATLVASDPSEARSLYALALAQLDAHELDPALRPALANALGFALICLGDLPAAVQALGRAERDALALGRARIVLYARFNRAICDELAGEVEQAHAALRAVREDATSASLSDIEGWAAVRSIWLDVRVGEVSSAAAALANIRGAAFAEATQVLRAILALRRSSDVEARALLRAVAVSLRSHGDDLARFAVLLWSALLEERAGRMAAARRAVAEACALGSERGYVLSPNWWTAEIVGVATRLASRAHVSYAASLYRPPDHAPLHADAHVVIGRDSSVSIAGTELGPEHWRVGRSGSGVLRRLFSALVAAHPAGLHRDELADLLWPESEGDKAVRNLYAATDDLRRLLADMPGVRLTSQGQRYVLVLAKNVELA